MRKQIAVLVIIAMALIGMAGAVDSNFGIQNMAQIKDANVKMIDVSNLTPAEIGLIFLDGNGDWFKDYGGIQLNPSQRAFLEDKGEGDIPAGYTPKKAAFVGSPQLPEDPR